MLEYRYKKIKVTYATNFLLQILCLLKSQVSCVVQPDGVSALLAPRVSVFVLDVQSHFLLPKKIRERLMKFTASLGLSHSQVTTLNQGMAYLLIVNLLFLTSYIVTIPRRPWPDSATPWSNTQTRRNMALPTDAFLVLDTRQGLFKLSWTPWRNTRGEVKPYRHSLTFCLSHIHWHCVGQGKSYKQK